MAEIKNLSHRHDAIMRFLLANPEMKMQDVAAEFAVTPAWLSTLIHSDLFQRRFLELRGELTDDVCFSVKDKLNELAHKSLDRLMQRVEAGAVETDDLLDVAELAVKNTLGIQPQRNGIPLQGFQQNIFISPGDLEQARRLMLQRRPQLELVPSLTTDGDAA